MPVVVEVNIIGLPELDAQLNAAPELLKVETGKAIATSVALAESEIKALTPRKTGRLFSAWEPSVVDAGGQWVGHLANKVEYAPYVEDGTRAHDIVAHGNALMIPIAKGGGFGGGKLTGKARSGQQVAFFKAVRHPGTKGVHMASEGLANAKSDILREFTNAVNRVLVTIRGALP